MCPRLAPGILDVPSTSHCSLLYVACIRAQYEPADSLEELWVEKIAAWTWRLRGQIARSVAGHRLEIQICGRISNLEVHHKEISQPLRRRMANKI